MREVVLGHLARYHAHKQRAALNLAWFDATGDRNALSDAKKSVAAGVTAWESLVKLTDGLYASEMANGPDDAGHWKDKLPYVRHDLELIREREEVLERFGLFDFGFDFGAEVALNPQSRLSYRSDPYVRLNSVAPISCSSDLICRLTADCVRNSSSAAALNDSRRATASKARRPSSESGRWRWIFISIQHE